MAYEFAYRIEHVNTEGEQIVANVFDTSTTAVSTTHIDITPAGQPITISVVDNDEDKFTTIRALQAELRFLSDPTYNLSFFATGNDLRWYVEIIVLGSSTYLFKGFVSMDDITEDFQDENNVVSLKCTDGIGLLKEIPLTKPDGTNPRGKFKISEYISWALRKTGLDLNFRVLWNIRFLLYTTEHAWDKIFIDAKTFEDEIGTCINCYDVLKYFLAESASLTQKNGKWVITRIEELDGRDQIWAEFDYDAASYAFTTITDIPVRLIGRTEVMGFKDQSAYVQVQRPLNSIKINYDYRYPREIIDNINFSRGNFNGVISVPAGSSAFDLDDWTVVKNSGSVTSTAYIRRDFQDGYEKERYVVFTAQSSSATPFDYIRANPVPMGAKDKATISVDFRWASNWTGVGGTTHYMFTIWLEVSSGNYYYYRQDLNAWYHTTILSNWYVGRTWDSQQVDESEWQSISVDLPPAPAAGNLYIGLLNGNVSSSSFDNVNMHYANLQFSYQPYINGSYQRYNGHYSKISQTAAGFKGKRENTIYITDAPRPLFKGATFYYNTLTSKYVAVAREGGWYDHSIHTSGTPPVDEVRNLDAFNAFDVWNQYNRYMRVLDGQIDGLETTIDEIPSTSELYEITDSSDHTDNKLFMCLHNELDLHDCSWNRGHFIEVADSTIAKDYDSTLEFKYVEER